MKDFANAEPIAAETIITEKRQACNDQGRNNGV